MKKKRHQMNIVLSEEEDMIVSVLRDKYGINISGCFKILLKNYWLQLKNKKIQLEMEKL